MQLIKEIIDNKEKSKVTNYILRRIPEWFGIEEAIKNYVKEVGDTDFYALFLEDKPIGFISIKSNNHYTSEIYVMGILKEYHNKGIGKKLLLKAEETLINKQVKFLMVKTLGESHPDLNYKSTRQFYFRAGFYPLEEIKEIWGKENPCLIMVKNLQ
ncbi:GNAT family N-acetyltransferase [Bacillus sp. BRMEA1]|uniref:GNAT family N-acetyltransferase n=1 Tax=Neobacillus endophyticus TaxID=2738405 RepID=UPI0015651F72|nr:GNAT family N-acetyltransferase [Neobacillus endophyticus]NRD80880.1 GNAT family N-acetyltransferase [Neobacillus endophyticus]